MCGYSFKIFWEINKKIIIDIKQLHRTNFINSYDFIKFIRLLLIKFILQYDMLYKRKILYTNLSYVNFIQIIPKRLTLFFYL